MTDNTPVPVDFAALADALGESSIVTVGGVEPRRPAAPSPAIAPATEQPPVRMAHVTLQKAIEATADRGPSYGTPAKNFERIADRWRAHVKNRFGIDVPFDAASVAMMNVDMKLARLENNPHHLDSWVDISGYAGCGAEVTE